MTLRLLTAMPDRPQQFRIRPRHSRQRVGIHLVALAAALTDYCTCLAFATITSWPSLSSNRLIHGECVPPSIAIRQRFLAPNVCSSAFLGVATHASFTPEPLLSRTQ